MASGGSWRDSYKGMSSDNIKGLVLALSSSFFIGASFIVKKKGLKKASASGVRAGTNTIFVLWCWNCDCEFNYFWACWSFTLSLRVVWDAFVKNLVWKNDESNLYYFLLSDNQVIKFRKKGSIDLIQT